MRRVFMLGRELELSWELEIVYRMGAHAWLQSMGDHAWKGAWATGSEITLRWDLIFDF
jgi:hypothetical protein